MVDAQLPVHELDQLLRRAKAQHGEAIARLKLVVGTCNSFETAAQDPCRNTAAGVADLEPQRDQPAAVLRREVDADASPVRPVDRAMKQRHQDLLEPARIPDHDVGHVRRRAEGDVEALGTRGLGNDGETAFDHRAHVEGMQRELELTAFNGGRVEPLVDDSRYLLRSRLDDRGELALFARLGAGRQEAGRAHHRVQLVAQLVAEVGEHVRIDMNEVRVLAVGAFVLGRRTEFAEFVHQ